MTQRQIIECDRCGATVGAVDDIRGDWAVIAASTVDGDDGRIGQLEATDDLQTVLYKDLCPTCMELLVIWFERSDQPAPLKRRPRPCSRVS